MEQQPSTKIMKKRIEFWTDEMKGKALLRTGPYLYKWNKKQLPKE